MVVKGEVHPNTSHVLVIHRRPESHFFKLSPFVFHRISHTRLKRHEFDRIFFFSWTVSLNLQLNASRDKSILLYCDVHQSVTDYWKRKMHDVALRSEKCVVFTGSRCDILIKHYIHNTCMNERLTISSIKFMQKINRKDKMWKVGRRYLSGFVRHSCVRWTGHSWEMIHNIY